MARDLGGDTAQVHAQAEAVLHFWFEEVPPEGRFAHDPGLDAECARRFKGLRDDLAATGAAGWWDDPRGLFAAVILLDQFSRNIYRGSAEPMPPIRSREPLQTRPSCAGGIAT